MSLGKIFNISWMYTSKLYCIAYNLLAKTPRINKYSFSTAIAKRLGLSTAVTTRFYIDFKIINSLGGEKICIRWANQSSVSQQGSTWWSSLYGQAGLGIQVQVWSLGIELGGGLRPEGFQWCCSPRTPSAHEHEAPPQMPARRANNWFNYSLSLIDNMILWCRLCCTSASRSARAFTMMLR